MNENLSKLTLKELYTLSNSYHSQGFYQSQVIVLTEINKRLDAKILALKQKMYKEKVLNK